MKHFRPEDCVNDGVIWDRYQIVKLMVSLPREQDRMYGAEKLVAHDLSLMLRHESISFGALEPINTRLGVIAMQVTRRSPFVEEYRSSEVFRPFQVH